jgi:hypothetical protein
LGNLKANFEARKSLDRKSLEERRSGTSCWHLRKEQRVCVTVFSRWVKGQAQGLAPGGFKLWVNMLDWIQRVQQPHRVHISLASLDILFELGAVEARGP